MKTTARSVLNDAAKYISGTPVKDHRFVEIIDDTVGTAFREQVMILINEILKVPDVMESIFKTIPTDYQINESWLESIRDNTKYNPCTVETIMYDIVASFLWDLLVDEEGD